MKKYLFFNSFDNTMIILEAVSPKASTEKLATIVKDPTYFMDHGLVFTSEPKKPEVVIGNGSGVDI